MDSRTRRGYPHIVYVDSLYLAIIPIYVYNNPGQPTLLRLGFAGGDETGQTAGDVRAWRNLVSDLPAGLANGHGRDQRDR